MMSLHYNANRPSGHLHLIKTDLGPLGMVSSDLEQISQLQPGGRLLLWNEQYNVSLPSVFRLKVFDRSQCMFGYVN